jgi:hypothetical protein
MRPTFEIPKISAINFDSEERCIHVTGVSRSPGVEKIALAPLQGTTHAYWMDWPALTNATYIPT